MSNQVSAGQGVPALAVVSVGAGSVAGVSGAVATPVAAPSPGPGKRPGLLLPESRDLSPAEWLTFRLQGIGSSEAAAVAGIDPWCSALGLWLEKTGRVVVDPETDPLAQDDHPAFWGKVLEPVVAEQYARRTGNRVRKVRVMHRHPRHDWMRASLDYQVIGNTAVQILECKTVGLHGARYWQEGVPDHVQLQVQHQLAVTGKAAADVAVLIGGQELRIYRVDRDEGLIAQLIELEARFWQQVQSDTPPAADGSEAAQEALLRLYPQDRGQVLDLSDNDIWNATFEQLLISRREVEEAKEFEARLRQSICERMGEASKAVFAGGSVSWKRARDSRVLDSGRLLREQPQLLEQYGTVREGSRRFLVSESR